MTLGGERTTGSIAREGHGKCRRGRVPYGTELCGHMGDRTGTSSARGRVPYGTEPPDGVIHGGRRPGADRFEAADSANQIANDHGAIANEGEAIAGNAGCLLNAVHVGHDARKLQRLKVG